MQCHCRLLWFRSLAISRISIMDSQDFHDFVLVSVARDNTTACSIVRKFGRYALGCQMLGRFVDLRVMNSKSIGLLWPTTRNITSIAPFGRNVPHVRGAADANRPRRLAAVERSLNRRPARTRVTKYRHSTYPNTQKGSTDSFRHRCSRYRHRGNGTTGRSDPAVPVFAY